MTHRIAADFPPGFIRCAKERVGAGGEHFATGRVVAQTTGADHGVGQP